MSKSSLRQRLLHDLAEFQSDPYPNIKIHIDDGNFTQGCLVLTPHGNNPLHMTIEFTDDYPLQPPRVQMQSRITHPNVFGNYICASILNTVDGWTPAYTLKGVAIQLLSFFASDKIEQSYGEVINLKEYGKGQRLEDNWRVQGRSAHYQCSACGFGTPRSNGNVTKKVAKAGNATQTHVESMDLDKQTPKFLTLADELLLMIFEGLDTKDLWATCRAFPEVQGILSSYDFIRVRELQCFCLKKGFLKTKLGVGVSILHTRKEGSFASEFDFLSKEAFDDHKVRRSVQGVPFEHWLPLPISRRHWRMVKPDLDIALVDLSKEARLENSSSVNVIYHFMNDVVVHFSRDAEDAYRVGSSSKSTLNHASEKAVEAYFALFHLLLCLATENPQLVRDVNRMILRFLSGSTSKTHFPSLGLLLVAVLISDHGLTEELTLAIIKETILRNVVWMLDRKGAGMAELSYLEPSAVSEYRLKRTFEASKTSYRLLMFLSLFCKTARVPGKSLESLRDDMFDTHGMPPLGTAERMAKQIREIREVAHFPGFLRSMGIVNMPSKEQFTTFLRNTITDSVKAGYSVLPVTQAQAFTMRRLVEPEVELAEGIDTSARTPTPLLDFFPAKSGRQRGGRQGGRGRGRGWR